MKKIMIFCLILMLAVGSVQGQEEHAHYDPEQEGILSGYYPIDPQTGFLTNVGCGTSPEQLTQACLPRDLRLSGDVVGTGARLENDRLSVTVIVTGDASGDGEISITDLLMTKSSILGTQLTDVQLAAADVTADGEVTITDFLRIKSHILGQSAITPQNRGGNTPMTLMTPGQTAVWLPGCVSDDEAVVTIDENGNIRAVAEGSAFVYAYEGEQLVGRTLVSVVSEPLVLTFDRTSYILTKGQSLSATYSSNHPVTSQIRWQTSDPDVVQVCDGQMTAVGNGKATVTAQISSGEPVELSVEVVTAVSDWVDIGLHRYYFDENGQMYHGWLQLDGDTYYLRETGVMAIGQVNIDGIDYFFTSKGKQVLMPNPWNPIPADYTVKLEKVGYVDVSTECAEELRQMVAAGKKAGYHLNVSSGYRSMATQQFLWNRNVQYYMDLGYHKAEAERRAGLVVAIPGHSEHQLGLAVDISKGNEPVLKWIRENCWEYGFILRYPTNKAEVTGISYEPWHFRYVGVELAMELKELGLCMEEYMDMLTRQEMEKEAPAAGAS